MALTEMTWVPSAVTRIVWRGGPPGQLRFPLKLEGDDAFTGATISEPGGASRWLRHPATMDRNETATFTIDPRMLRARKYTTTIRATKDSITADVVIVIHVRTADIAAARRR